MKKLSELRRERGLSRRKLADLSGVSYAIIRSIENHKTYPAYSYMVKIAEVLGVDAVDIEETNSLWKEYLKQAGGKKQRKADNKRAMGFLCRLSKSELMILDLMAQGYNRERIARELGIKPKTFKNHVNSIYRKVKAGEEEDVRNLAVALYNSVTTNFQDR